MPRQEFSRIDLLVALRRQEDGGVIVRTDVTGLGLAEERQVPPAVVADWLKHNANAEARIPDLQLHFAPPLQNVSAWDNAARRAQQDALTALPRVQVQPRLALDVDDPELAALPWESSLVPFVPPSPVLWPQPLIVRVSPVRARVTTIPLTLPLRILQIDPAPGRDFPAMVGSVFGSRPYSEVVQAHALPFSEVDAELASARLLWPTVGVLHFDRLPALDDPERLLTTASPDEPGTLGWLCRLADGWQTRLIILHCENEAQAVAGRTLGTRIVNRGGPAVLVAHLRHGWAVPFYQQFYSNLIHDFPLDVNLRSSLPYGADVGTEPYPSLIAGGGREEALRVSSLGIELLKLHAEISGQPEPPPPGRIEPVVSAPRKPILLPGISAYIQRGKPRQPGRHLEVEKTVSDIGSTLGEMRQTWDTFRFEFHESEGVLPLSERLSEVRRLAGVSGPALMGAQQQKRRGKRGDRYVNPGLWTVVGDRLEQLDQVSSRLVLNETVHLGIQVGPKDKQVETIGASALIEEVFKRTPKMRGVWVEIGVTGLDFDMIGEPVQELWLPRSRSQATERIYFAVVPKVAGVSRLRFCLYYRQNVIQSFRLAALTLSKRGETDPPLEERRKLLARALDISDEQVGDRGYLPRLEYSIALSAEAIRSRPERALSLVANDLDDKPVITLKGGDLFGVLTNRDLPRFVSRVRNVMDEVCTPPVEGVNRKYWDYGFGLPNKPNAARPETLKEALKKMAEVGWQLFDAVIAEDQREKLAEKLEPERQKISAAHVLLEKVIPWAAVYDRQYDPNKQLDDAGQPVGYDACLAALPGNDGKLPVTRCGQHPNCLLHAEKLKKRHDAGDPVLLPETVACPLHFWGFKHIVEVPPQQVADGTSGGHAQQDRVTPERKAQLVAGIHAGLQFEEAHRQALDQLVAAPNAPAVWKAKEWQRDNILKELKDVALDLIYFYCHAYGGRLTQPEVWPPYLEFQVAGQKPGQITSDQFQYAQRWAHHPLVFLNGCGTGAFTPDALSPFIIKFVQGRGAAGVICTEMPVWEALAGEMAVSFLGEFLAGKPAGEALLLARRALLAQNNPLGLAYTLYAAEQLVLGRGKE